LKVEAQIKDNCVLFSPTYWTGSSGQEMTVHRRYKEEKKALEAGRPRKAGSLTGGEEAGALECMQGHEKRQYIGRYRCKPN
jgi:hypothetical protein